MELKLERPETKEEATKQAILWQEWSSRQNLYWSEVAEWSNYFKGLAKEFDLVEEFEENGII